MDYKTHNITVLFKNLALTVAVIPIGVLAKKSHELLLISMKCSIKNKNKKDTPQRVSENESNFEGVVGGHSQQILQMIIDHVLSHDILPYLIRFSKQCFQGLTQMATTLTFLIVKVLKCEE